MGRFVPSKSTITASRAYSRRCENGRCLAASKDAVKNRSMAEQRKGESTEVSRILLLEDDEALGRGICMALETPNCTVTHCSTRLQAIKILQGVVFDLLILDINLPDGSGLELLRTLRQNGTSTPAILLTANDLELDEVTGLETGADDYITKPFSLAVLRTCYLKQERIELRHPRLWSFWK